MDAQNLGNDLEYISIPREEYRDLIAENVRMGITLDNLHDLIECEDLAYAKAMGDSKAYYESSKIKHCIHYSESSWVADKIKEYIAEYQEKEEAKKGH